MTLGIRSRALNLISLVTESKSRVLWVYNTGPIDSWEGWRTPEQLANDLAGTPVGMDLEGNVIRSSPDIWAMVIERAVRIAEAAVTSCTYWEGDKREGPYFAPLPDPGTCSTVYMVAWKQDNNGDLFVVSPVSLPYLGAVASNGIRDYSIKEVN
jgi:hypothetical protein